MNRQSSADLEAVADRYGAINIKLDNAAANRRVDKEWCREEKVMVGNMLVIMAAPLW